MKTNSKQICFERIGVALGFCCALVLFGAFTATHAAAADTVIQSLPLISYSMPAATLVGAVGSYLSFGADKKFPPSANAVGHILLGFGAGLFFTHGSLELMGRLNNSESVVVFVSFLWAVGGYFLLRLGIAVIDSEQIRAILPKWIAKRLGIGDES